MLERYAFFWLMALLVFSAVAMFLGAKPLVLMLFGHSSSAVYSLLDLSWVICGVAAAYLTYLWVQNGKQVLGGNETKDKMAFWFMLLAGYNLGITGLLNQNIFLSIFMSQVIWLVTGVLCLLAVYHLWNRWQANGESLFGSGVDSSEGVEPVEAAQSEEALMEQASDKEDEERESGDRSEV